MIHVVKLLVFIFSMTLINGHCENKYAKGWWFYQDKVETATHNDPDQTAINGEVVTRPSPEVIEEQLKAIQKEMEYRKNLAFLYPSHENIKYYRELQNQIVEQASIFSDSWMHVTSTNRHLDASVERPMSQAGAIISEQEREKFASETIKSLSDTHGLIYVYAGSCSHCKKMASIVRGFADNHGLDLMGLSVDGVILNEIPNNETDLETAQVRAIEWGVEGVPALIIFDNVNKTRLPTIYGFKTEDILKATMLRIILGVHNG